MFLNTLNVPYYDWLIGNSNKDFSDVVSVGEMIEAEVKQGKIESAEAKKPISKRKKEKLTRCHTKEEPTIPHTHHNKTMVISLITNMMGMLCKGITSQIPGLWKDSPRYLHQYRF